MCRFSPTANDKGNRLLISSKYHSVKSLNVYIFIVSGSALLARRASCQGDLLLPHKKSLAPGKRTGVLSRSRIFKPTAAYLDVVITPAQMKWPLVSYFELDSLPAATDLWGGGLVSVRQLNAYLKRVMI